MQLARISAKEGCSLVGPLPHRINMTGLEQFIVYIATLKYLTLEVFFQDLP